MTLTPRASEFLTSLLPWGPHLRDQVRWKASFKRPDSPGPGIREDLLLAHVLEISDYGGHPLAAIEWEKKDANNLTLLRAEKGWVGKVILYKKLSYRSYRNWEAWAEDWTDHLVWSGLYDKVLYGGKGQQVSLLEGITGLSYTRSLALLGDPPCSTAVKNRTSSLSGTP